MSETAELNVAEVATRLLPLLKEYATKLADISERTPRLLGQLQGIGLLQEPMALEVARLVSLHESLKGPVRDLAREASGLYEHAALEYYLRGELKLRLDELEEHIRFSDLGIAAIVRLLTSRKNQAEAVRELIKKSGHYQAPF